MVYAGNRLETLSDTAEQPIQGTSEQHIVNNLDTHHFSTQSLDIRETGIDRRQ